MARRETWGDVSRRVIARVISENPNAEYKEMKKLLREAYPFGRREMFPYTAWCKAQKRALTTLFPEKMGVKKEVPNVGLFADESNV